MDEVVQVLRILLCRIRISKAINALLDELLNVNHRLREIRRGVINVDQTDNASQHAHWQQQRGFGCRLAQKGGQGEVGTALRNRAEEITVALHGGFQDRRFGERQLKLIKAGDRLTFFR